MPQVIIEGNTYTIYANLATASAYLLPTSYNETWSALTPDEQAGRLVESARILDRQKWKPEYDAFSERVLVEGIVNASITIAAMLASGENEFTTNATTSNLTHSLKAGSASITYFRDFSAAGAGTRFPLAIMELLGAYLSSNGTGSRAVGGSFVSGVCQKSEANARWGYWSGI